jgi:xanthine/uracil permease
MTASSEKVGKALAHDGHRAGVTIFDLRYDLEDKPAPIPSILFGLQHVLIMFTAMIASPLVIASVPPNLHILASDGIVVGTVTAILLNCLLPEDKKQPAQMERSS